jgi:hypothetical protein
VCSPTPAVAAVAAPTLVEVDDEVEAEWSAAVVSAEDKLDANDEDDTDDGEEIEVEEEDVMAGALCEPFIVLVSITFDDAVAVEPRAEFADMLFPVSADVRC